MANLPDSASVIPNWVYNFRKPDGKAEQDLARKVGQWQGAVRRYHEPDR